MNGAGAGGRFVAKRNRATGLVTAGGTQLGSREQRRADLRAAFGAGG